VFRAEKNLLHQLGMIVINSEQLQHAAINFLLAARYPGQIDQREMRPPVVKIEVPHSMQRHPYAIRPLGFKYSVLEPDLCF